MALFRTGLYVKNHSVEKVQVAKTPIASYNGNVTGLYIPELIAYITAKQSGSGDPAPDNIRPFIGVSECNVVRCGVNVLPTINKNTTDFSMDSNGYYTQNVPSSASWAWAYSKRLAQATLPAGDYICSFYASTLSSNNNAEMRIYTSGGTELGRVKGKNLTTTSITFTLTQETTIGVIAKIYDGKWAFQIENGSTASYSFELYTGNTYTIQLGDTYYGGSLDVTTGVLTVDKAIVDMSTLSWAYQGTNHFFYCDITGIKRPASNSDVPNCICSIYKVVARNGFSDTDMAFSVNATNDGVRVNDSRYTDADTFTAAMNGVQLVYGLATPITVQLTPTQIEQLLGMNNVWADTGNVAVKFNNVIR